MNKITKEEIILNELNNQNDWIDLCLNYKLTEDIMDEFADKIEWNIICMSQNLSENFMRKHQNKVNWKYIVNKYIKLNKKY